MAKKRKQKPTIGQKIRAARDAAELTQAEAAENAGLSEAYWSQLEIGFREPSLKALGKIAKALGCTVADLLP